MQSYDAHKEAAIRSVEVGPCPSCGHTWNADPRPSTARCPRCSETGDADNSDAPTVEVGG